MTRPVAIVGIANRALALRRLFEGLAGPTRVESAIEDAKGQLRKFAPDRSRMVEASTAVAVRHAISDIQNGSAETIFLVGAAAVLVLKERNAAQADGENCYAVLSADSDAACDAEHFECDGDLCASIATAALSVFYRFLPAGPARASRRPWLAAGPRRAIVGASGEASFALVEDGRPPAFPATTLAMRSMQLIPISADTPEQIDCELQATADRARRGEPLRSIARQALVASLQTPGHRFGLALTARDGAELLREVDLMRQGILRSSASGEEWKTPAGSCFTANPLGNTGVAFVYPGVASPYEGVGADLLAIAPGLTDAFERICGGQAARYLHLDEIYPRLPSRHPRFWGDVVALGESAMSVSILLTMLIRESFGVQPRSALGYSFGEAIMAAALGVWRTPTELTDRLERSPTFRSRLQGPMCAVREHWGIPEGAPLDWRSYCIRATAAEAYAAVARESRAYLCMINAPDQVVIAGEQQAASRVLATLGSAAVPLGVAVTMHCQPARSEYDELVRIHDLETTSSPAPALFSSSEYAPAPADRASLAHAIAGGYTKTLDFPRLVRRVYAEGARVFLELGGRRNCSTWIEKILRGRPHAAIPCDSEGLPGDAAILRAIARLFAHRVPLNLAVLDDCD